MATTCTTATDVSNVGVTLPKSKTSQPQLSSEVAALLYLEDALSDVGGKHHSHKGSNTVVPSTNNYSQKQMQTLMAEVNAVLSKLAEELLEFEYQTSQTQSGISNANLTLAQNQLTQTMNQVAQYEQELQAQQNQPWWKKLLDILLPVLSCVASVFMGPEMMLLTAVLMAVQYSGGFTALANALISAGCPGWAADLVVTAIIMVASAACGSMGAAAKAVTSDVADAATTAASSTAKEVATTVVSSVAKGAETVGSDVAGDVTQELDSTLAQTSSKIGDTAISGTKAAQKELSNLQKVLSRLTPGFTKAGALGGAKMATIMGVMSLMQGQGTNNQSIVSDIVTSIVNDLPDSCFPGGKQNWTMALEIAVTAILIVAAITVGVKGPSNLNSALKFNFSNFVTKLSTVLNYVAAAGLGGASIGEGVFQVEQANIFGEEASTQTELASSSSALQLFQDLEKLTASFMQATSGAIASDEQDVQSLDNDTLASFMKPMASVLQVLESA
ncbi:MAG: hypothetical protein HY860_06060 [Chlamydiales bacterium]|nr:hypothetical protein [Chlamydiales bacterium]